MRFIHFQQFSEMRMPVCTSQFFFSFINMQGCMSEGTVCTIELRDPSTQIQIDKMHFTCKCKRSAS